MVPPRGGGFPSSAGGFPIPTLSYESVSPYLRTIRRSCALSEREVVSKTSNNGAVQHRGRSSATAPEYSDRPRRASATQHGTSSE
eukprot:3255591-Pyramimonas_sp.AAC.2